MKILYYMYYYLFMKKPYIQAICLKGNIASFSSLFKVDMVNVSGLDIAE